MAAIKEKQKELERLSAAAASEASSVKAAKGRVEAAKQAFDASNAQVKAALEALASADKNLLAAKSAK